MPKWMPEACDIMALTETWARAYQVPREAIVRQIPLAYAWCLSNTKKAPKKQITRFLYTWMKNAQRWGNLRVPAPVQRREPDPEGDMTVEEMREIRRRNMPAYR